MSNGSRSIIDHFIVTENLCEYIKTTSICHDINNISDHSILCISFDIAVRGLPFHNQGGVRVFTPEYNFFFLSQ